MHQFINFIVFVFELFTSLKRQSRSIFFHACPFTCSLWVTALWHFEGVSESSHREEMSSQGHMFEGMCFQSSLLPAGERLHIYCEEVSLALTDVTTCTFTWLHMQNADKGQHVRTYSNCPLIRTSKHYTVHAALPRDRKLYVMFLKSIVFLIRAAGYICNNKYWVDCLLALHKLDISADGLCPCLSFLSLWHLKHSKV